MSKKPMKKTTIMALARERFPGKASHLRKLGGVDELVVSEPRDPNVSLTSSVSRQRYIVVRNGDSFDFVKD